VDQPDEDVWGSITRPRPATCASVWCVGHGTFQRTRSASAAKFLNVFRSTMVVHRGRARTSRSVGITDLSSPTGRQRQERTRSRGYPTRRCGGLRPVGRDHLASSTCHHRLIPANTRFTKLRPSGTYPPTPQHASIVRVQVRTAPRRHRKGEFFVFRRHARALRRPPGSTAELPRIDRPGAVLLWSTYFFWQASRPLMISLLAQLGSSAVHSEVSYRLGPAVDPALPVGVRAYRPVQRLAVIPSLPLHQPAHP
jgi:hypothetical protein